MAKARFHKNQRVYVKPVGTWAQIEHLVPQWAKGVEEPIKITYDVGLGREFGAEELEAENNAERIDTALGEENWRLIRGQNKWMPVEKCSHHPFPGTYPVVVTNERDWGGWRVPGAEYDLDPQRIEYQARIIANSVRSVNLLRRLLDYAEQVPEDCSNSLMDIIHEARGILGDIQEG